MSTGESALGTKVTVWERAAEYLNPILVKETRQALKSRQFVLTFILLLIAAWAVSVFGMALSEESLEYGSTGRSFFFGFYIVLAVATTLAVPFGAHRSLLAERDLNTYDLLSITTLSPGKIVRGKLASAVLQLFIFYSAITPFMAFASLLNGFDTPTAAFVLVMSLLWSLLLCMASLMFATLARNRLAQGFLSLVVLCGLGLGLCFQIAMLASAIEFNEIPFDDEEFWWLIGIFIAGGASYFFLFQQITVAQLTFDSDNRTTGIRVAASVQFWLMFAAFVLLAWFSGGSLGLNRNDLQSLLIPVTLHWAVFGLFSATEPDMLSRRVRRELPRWRVLRLLLLPFLPGGARGYLWVVLSVASFWLCVLPAHSLGVGTYTPTYTSVMVPPGSSMSMPGMPPTVTAIPSTPASSPILSKASLVMNDLMEQVGAVISQFPGGWPAHLQVSTALCCYLLIYLGIGAAGSRWLRMTSRDVNSAHMRVLTFLVLMAGTMFPFLPKALRVFLARQGYSLYDITSPFQTVDELWNGNSPYGSAVLLILMAAAGTIVLINTPAMLRATRVVMAEQTGPRSG